MKKLRLTSTNVDVQSHKLNHTKVNGYSIILTNNSAIPSALSIEIKVKIHNLQLFLKDLKIVIVSAWAGIMFTFTVMLILRWQAQ